MPHEILLFYKYYQEILLFDKYYQGQVLSSAHCGPKPPDFLN